MRDREQRGGREADQDAGQRGPEADRHRREDRHFPAKGESAAAPVLRELRDEFTAVSSRLGLMEGYDCFMRVIHGVRALRSCLWAIGQEVLDNREMTTGRNPDEVSHGVRLLLDEMEELLSEKVLKYAVHAPE